MIDGYFAAPRQSDRPMILGARKSGFVQNMAIYMAASTIGLVLLFHGMEHGNAFQMWASLPVALALALGGWWLNTRRVQVYNQNLELEEIDTEIRNERALIASQQNALRHQQIHNETGTIAETGETVERKSALKGNVAIAVTAFVLMMFLFIHGGITHNGIEQGFAPAVGVALSLGGMWFNTSRVEAQNHAALIHEREKTLTTLQDQSAANEQLISAKQQRRRAAKMQAIPEEA